MLTDVWTWLRPSAETWAAAFGAGTVLLAVAVSVPQFVRLMRCGAAGVSLPAVLNSAISFLAWTLYALGTGDGWLIASSALGLPFAAATAGAAWRHGARRSGLWVPAVWTALLCFAWGMQAATGWELVSLAVGGSIGWLVVPAGVTAWTSSDLSGVAAGSWLALAVEGMLFLGYGVTGSAQAPVLYGAVALLGSAVVLLRIALPRAADTTRSGSGTRRPDDGLSSFTSTQTA